MSKDNSFRQIDKTGLVHDLLNNWGEVNLFTRPRRFGKTLNMNMLKAFFEIGCVKTLFDGLKIMQDTELCEAYMGKYPVISISLKGVNGNDFEAARSMMCSVIGKEALRFQFLSESDRLTEVEKALYSQLIAVDNTSVFKISDAALMGSLYMLSALLKKHYDSDVIMLIDEYDVPLAKANENGYYDQMIMLIRNMFEQALKTNNNLKFAVLTGCLRVAKESIFTGLNNMKILSVTDVRFDEYFGFTDSEVRTLLEYYCLSDHYETIRHFLKQAGPVTKHEIEELVAGGTVKKVLRQNLTYKDMYDSVDNIWSLLFTTGYLLQCFLERRCRNCTEEVQRISETHDQYP